MNEIEAQIKQLEAAIASGARRVTFRSGGTEETIEYRTLSDMNAAISMLRDKLNPVPRVRTTVAGFRSGW